MSKTEQIASKDTGYRVRQEPEHHTVEMSEHIQAIEMYLGRNPSLGKGALVQLLTNRFPNLSRDQTWVLVSRYFNDRPWILERCCRRHGL